MYKRVLDIKGLTRSKSLILLGPRQTGKSTLLKVSLPEAQFFNLLDDSIFRQFISHPELLRQLIKRPNSKNSEVSYVVIDEIQRIPNLLNEVQLILDSRKDIRFVLTGSSARKLRRGHANLLGGRAHFSQLYPLTYFELNSHLRLSHRIARGSLPSIIDSDDYKEDLKSYVGGYLKEEIQAESLVRNVGNFARFLETAAICNAEQVNFTQIGSDTGVPPRTVRDFFTLLEDTLVGNFLEPFSQTKKRKAVATPKFYFFDLGVVNALLSRFTIAAKTPTYGNALEHLIYLEIKAWLAYHRRDEVLRYWRSQTQFEVDFTIGENAAVEVKAKTRVSEADLKGLRALKEEKIFKNYYVVSLESQARYTDDGIEILPLENFLQMLWSGQLGLP